MEKRNQRLKSLKQQILAAHDGHGFSPELIQAIAAHCRHRRAEGRTPGYIAQELGISEWQVADWMHQEATHEQQPQQVGAPQMFELKVPLTYRFERLLTREITRSMQQCDSCCWRQLVRSLPGGFRFEEDE